MVDIGKCNICNTRDGAAVLCSGFGPISLVYCKECVQHGAEPEWGLRYLLEDVGGGSIEGLKKDMLPRTYKDGKFMSFEEWMKSLT